MPINCERIILKTEEREILPAVNAGSSREIQMNKAKIHVFCSKADKSDGTLIFSGIVEDLTYIHDGQAKQIQQDQKLVINADEQIVFDDEIAIVFRHTNVLASFQKNVSADKM